MPLQILNAPSANQDVQGELQRAIAQAFPEASVEVGANSPGHYEIRVVCASFEGQSRVKQQQRVYAAIAHLMKGDGAAVHAIDRLQTATS